MFLLILAGCMDQALTQFNAPPTATILAPTTGDTLPEGEVLSLRGVAGDPDDPATDLQVAWFLGATPVCEGATADVDGTVSCTVPAPAPGATTARLEVVDPGGEVAVAEVDFAVLTDDAPTVTIVTPEASDLRVYATEEVALVAYATDDEDAPEALQMWATLNDESLVERAPGGQIDTRFVAVEGEHILVAYALDSAGNESATAVSLHVGPANRTPTCAITAPLDGAVGLLGDALTLVGAVDDADIGPAALSVAWASDLDGALGTPTADATGAVSTEVGPLSAGTHRISLRATDERGLACEDAVTFAVGSAPSVVIEAPLDFGVYAEAAEVVLLGTVVDAEDLPEELFVTWSSDLDGALGSGLADATGAHSLAVMPSPGVHVLTATVTDPLGLSGSASVTLIVDAIPSAPGLSITPTDPEAGDALTCTVTTPATDPEGAALTYSFAWDVDGLGYTGATDLAESSEVPGGDVAAGTLWTCTATANDGTSAGPAGSASVAVADDLDGDGWASADDCDDSDARVNPGEVEVCGDGLDNDCDPATGDGGTTEVCNGVDDDCDGSVDDVSGTITTQAEADALVDCTQLSGLYVHMASGVVSVELPVLTRVNGPVYLHAAPDVVTLSLPALTEVTSYVYLYHNPALTDVDLGSLTTVGEYLYFDGNTVLSTVDLGSIASIAGYLYLSNNSAWCTPASALTTATVGSAYVGGNLCN